MHSEVQIAVNFVLSFLYNKLPRRRVNQFGEELELVLKSKFEDHWFPETPFKASAFRCLRFTRPLDPFVFDVAAQRSGLSILDIQEHIPVDLTIWIDPGEVSYRIGDVEPVRTLFSRKPAEQNANDENLENSGTTGVCSALNPNAPSFTPLLANRSQPNQITYTAADFAATKFGSTKRRVNNVKKSKPIEMNGGYGGRPAKFSKTSGSFGSFGHFGLPNGPSGNFAQNRSFLVEPFGEWMSPPADSCQNFTSSQTTPPTTPFQSENISMAGSVMGNNGSTTAGRKPDGQTSIWSMQESECNFLFNSSFLDRYLPREHNFRATLEATTFGSGSNFRPNVSSNRWADDFFAANPVFDSSSTSKSFPTQDGSTASSATSASVSGNDLSGYYSSSCTLSSLSSPSLASTDFSLHLINEFDNLSLNSASSSSIGSMSSCVN